MCVACWGHGVLGTQLTGTVGLCRDPNNSNAALRNPMRFLRAALLAEGTRMGITGSGSVLSPWVLPAGLCQAGFLPGLEAEH